MARAELDRIHLAIETDRTTLKTRSAPTDAPSSPHTVSLLSPDNRSIISNVFDLNAQQLVCAWDSIQKHLFTSPSDECSSEMRFSPPVIPLESVVVNGICRHSPPSLWKLLAAAHPSPLTQSVISSDAVKSASLELSKSKTPRLRLQPSTSHQHLLDRQHSKSIDQMGDYRESMNSLQRLRFLNEDQETRWWKHPFGNPFKVIFICQSMLTVCLCRNHQAALLQMAEMWTHKRMNKNWTVNMFKRPQPRHQCA